ncbi:Hypothetical predicted protein [Mytilus galloprovincialis]|uniref:Uncharacterized protein n=2 Tax=Mytilus galloprovincialis TaxID=29158 RepID=A0A8B6F999_MYTGA|nr:Hypothetical predicted protein [Mytilus galloprovincialis]
MGTKNALMAVVVLLVLIGSFELVDSFFTGQQPQCYRRYCYNNWDCSRWQPWCYCRKIFKGSRLGRCSW